MTGISEGARRLPAPPLRPYLGPYAGYRLAGFEPGTHIGMPGPYLTTIVTIGPPIELSAVTHAAQAPGVWDMLASGLVTAPCTIRHDGNQHGIQLALTPLGCRALYGVPTAELGAWIVDLDDVLGADARELRERVSACVTWDARFDVLDEVLGRRIAEFELDATLARAWRLLIGEPGVRVAEVAAEVGWSRRQLVNRFGAEFGVTPKQAARIGRFHRSHRLLQRTEIPPLAQVAAECGYYDQAHLAREWRELAGMSPSRWRADEVFTFVQGDDATGPAESSS